jgi:cytochrome c-type biogenesis protein CcmH/NrfF
VILRVAAIAAAALLCAGPAAAACAHPKTSLSYLEGQIMCPTCHTTLDQSDSQAAVRIKVLIQGHIDRCESADQIRTMLVANYGARILAAPTHKGFDLLAWWLPLGGVIGGAAVLAFGMWRWSRKREGDGPDAGDAPLDTPLNAADEQRLDEALARLD